MEYLKVLEAEAIYIFRETIAQFTNPVILFSGGKDSTILLHLAKKAYHPVHAPFKVLHIDTGHNFPEVLEFRDRIVHREGWELIVRKVEDTIREKGIVEPNDKLPSRNELQSITLTDAIKELGIDACIGGGRRDEEKARAKERIFSFRSEDGKWQPYNQRPELWDIYNGRIKPGQNVRVFPISNWTELDVWNYIKQEQIEIPALYYAHERECLVYKDKLVATSEYIRPDKNDEIVTASIRYRTVGDMTCTAAVRSAAKNIEEVIAEIAASKTSERGETRMDDQFSDAAMEDRKLKGYF